MLMLLIYMFLKRTRNPKRAAMVQQVRKYIIARVPFFFITLLVLLLLLIPILVKTQSLLLYYKIVQGGDEIGWLRLEKNIAGSQSRLLLVSEINTRFIIRIRVSATESSTFENGKLVHSAQFRKTNGETKVDKQTRLVSGNYEVMENGGTEKLSIRFIGTNLLSLYFQEPVGINQVYCDKHAGFITVTKTGDGGYRVKFPDGNSNIFYYSRGICTRIRISHTFYTAEIIKTT
ncbi:MAG: hypothetical protein IPG38_12285 [Chitinophagaceae bacterium]|nr:hypothetical protein [Chitinophagaceae bacterium]MBK7558762.1 hypothetical protein [Chitinophagaceae bacterium]MBK9530757.1 hypothetical protein [Chitinophagaceae bacterium]